MRDGSFTSSRITAMGLVLNVPVIILKAVLCIVSSFFRIVFCADA